MRVTPRIIAVLSAVLVACGGDGTGPGGGNAAFSATIGGSAWTAASATVAAQGSTNGTFVVVGGELGSAGTARTLSLILYNIDALGTYAIGVGPTARGGIGTVSGVGAAVSTPLSGAAGSVTISAVSATHIAGTFAFTAGTAPTTVQVTGGSFDLPVTSTGSIAVAPYAGNQVTGTIDGAAWNAATIVLVSPPSSGSVAMGASNDMYSINFTFSGWTGAGTYALGSGVSRTITVVKSGTTQSWGGSLAPGTGSLVITTATTTRFGGTFDVILPPSNGGGGASLHFVGTLDAGVQP